MPPPHNNETARSQQAVWLMLETNQPQAAADRWGYQIGNDQFGTPPFAQRRHEVGWCRCCCWWPLAEGRCEVLIGCGMKLMVFVGPKRNVVNLLYFLDFESNPAHKAHRHFLDDDLHSRKLLKTRCFYIVDWAMFTTGTQHTTGSLRDQLNSSLAGNSTTWVDGPFPIENGDVIPARG